MAAGTLVWLQRTPSRRAPCEAVDSGVLRIDSGLEGDRHARPASSRQVVLVSAEVLDQLGLPYGATREQLTIAGLGPLGAGDIVTIGDARVELVRERVPCRVMEGVRKGLEHELRGRGGWCGRVTATGAIRIGDPVTLVPAATTDGDPPWLHDYLLAITAWESSPPKPAEPSGWGFPERLAHLVAWDERGAERIDALASGAPDQHWGADDIDGFNAAAVARLAPRGSDDLDRLWVLHDTCSTAVVEAARRHSTIASAWVKALTAHYQEHT